MKDSLLLLEWTFNLIGLKSAAAHSMMLDVERYYLHELIEECSRKSLRYALKDVLLVYCMGLDCSSVDGFNRGIETTASNDELRNRCQRIRKDF